jgi:hypothetical protein
VAVTVAVDVAENVAGAVHVDVAWFVCVTDGVNVGGLKIVCVKVGGSVAV